MHEPLLSNLTLPVHLPNMVRKIVRTCFMPQRPSNRAIDPIGHVLNKAWPMRCSVRNFSEIVSSYILRDTGVYMFVCTVMHACMAGVYPTSRAPCSLRLRMILYKHYVLDRVSPRHLSEWVQHGNHAIVFVAIKEYIAFAVSMVPGLSHVLQREYQWSDFVASVTAQADVARHTLDQHCHDPSRMFDAARDAMQGVKVFKCPTPSPDNLHICDTITGILRSTCTSSEDVYKTPLRVHLYNSIQKSVVAGVPIHRIAACCGVGRKLVDSLEQLCCSTPSPSAWKQVRSIEPCKDGNALLTHEFMVAWSMCIQIHLYNLPSHIQKEQMESTSQRNTRVYACSCCRQIRAFIVDEGRSASNAWARGHHKVLLDDSNGILYCGKRVEKASSHSRRLKQPSNVGRSYWKAQQSLMCGYCPLLCFDMLGKLLSFYGKLYCLCPTCRCMMAVSPECYVANSMKCVNCRYQNSSAGVNGVTCFHCCVECQDAVTFEIKDGHRMTACTACSRWWMNDRSIVCQLDEATVHRAINERWSSNRLQTLCDRI